MSESSVWPPTTEEIYELMIGVIGAVPERIEMLRSGAWSTALLIGTTQHTYVLRFSNADDDFRCDAHATAFSSPELPIPQVHGIGRFRGHWWCLSDFVNGSHLDDLNDSEIEALIPSWAQSLISMRDIRDPGTQGYGGWDRHGNGRFASFAEQLLDVTIDSGVGRGGGWRPILAEHSYELQIFEIGVSLLKGLTPRILPERQLIHADTLNFNIKCACNLITGVFDWGCAMWGDAIYDLAWVRFWEPWYPQWNNVDLSGRLERIVGIEGPFPQERMGCCLLHIGLMHIRYNALIRNFSSMNAVALETERLLEQYQ